MRKLFSFLLGFFLFAPLALAEFQAPSYQGFVTDLTTGTLTANEKQTLEETLQNYANTTQNEIAILIIDTTDGMEISDYAIKVGNAWGIGHEGIDNGILMVAAMSDRDFFIATGSQTEGYLTDAKSGEIWRTIIRPHFRDSNYALGLTQGLEAITATLSGQGFENLVSETDTELSDSEAISIIALGFIFIMGFIWLGAILGRSKTIWPGGLIGLIGGSVLGISTGDIAVTITLAVFIGLLGLAFDAIVSGEYKSAGKSGRSPKWWSGGGSSSGSSHSSGGGFGGFGGGGFSGGGGGGSW